MVKKHSQAQLHKDQVEYVSRVFNAGGNISPSVQKKINKFIKTHYRLGLRDITGNSHTILKCGIFLTKDKRGSENLIWGNEVITESSVGAYAISEEKGAVLVGKNSGSSFISVPPILGISGDDCSIGYYLTKIAENTGEIGAVVGDFPNDRRFFSHPQYTGTRGIYFDVGNDNNSRRVSGTIPIAGSKDNRGLTICSKLGATSQISLRNQQVTFASQTQTSSPMPENELKIRAGYSSLDNLSIGGFWFGRSVDNTLFADLNLLWDELQLSVHPQRATSIEPIPYPKIWLDASDLSTLTNSSGSIVSTSGGQVTVWKDKSGNNKDLSTSDGNSIQYLPEQKGLNKLANTTTNLSRADGYYFGTVAFVLTTNTAISKNSPPKSILQHSSYSTFESLGFGSKTSWLVDEIFWFVGNNGRLGVSSSSLIIPANTRFLFILSRTGDRTGLAKYNRITYTASPANQGNLLPVLVNSPLIIGSNIEIYSGILCEFRNYSEAFTSAQMDVLANELCDKWGIP